MASLLDVTNPFKMTGQKKNPFSDNSGVQQKVSQASQAVSTGVNNAPTTQAINIKPSRDSLWLFAKEMPTIQKIAQQPLNLGSIWMSSPWKFDPLAQAKVGTGMQSMQNITAWPTQQNRIQSSQAISNAQQVTQTKYAPIDNAVGEFLSTIYNNPNDTIDTIRIKFPEFDNVESNVLGELGAILYTNPNITMQEVRQKFPEIYNPNYEAPIQVEWKNPIYRAFWWVGWAIGWVIKWFYEWTTTRFPDMYKNIQRIGREELQSDSVWERLKGVGKSVIWEPIAMLWWIIGDTFAGWLEWLYKGFTSKTERKVVDREVKKTMEWIIKQKPAQDILMAYDSMGEKQKQEFDDLMRYAMGALDMAWLWIWAKPVTQGTKALAKTAQETLEQGTKTATKQIDNIIDGIWKTMEERAINQGKKVTEKADNIVGQIIQWKTDDIKPALNIFKTIDTKGTKTYSQLSDILEKEWKNTIKHQDEVLSQHNWVFKPDDTIITTTVGETTIKQSPVKKAINQLDELYSKIDDPFEQAKIKELDNKFTKSGLTTKELNDLARKYNSEFGDKAFSKVTWDPLTSINAQAFENNRKAIKEFVRNVLPDDTSRMLDKKYSDIVSTKKLVDNMVEKVNTLQQKINERWLIEKLWRWISRIVDSMSWWLLRWAFTAVLPSNIGNKVLNSLDLEKALKKNLQQLDTVIKKIDNWTATKADFDKLLPKNTPTAWLFTKTELKPVASPTSTSQAKQLVKKQQSFQEQPKNPFKQDTPTQWKANPFKEVNVEKKVVALEDKKVVTKNPFKERKTNTNQKIKIDLHKEIWDIRAEKAFSNAHKTNKEIKQLYNNEKLAKQDIEDIILARQSNKMNDYLDRWIASSSESELSLSNFLDEITPKPLLEEARKYKSAEDMIDNMVRKSWDNDIWSLAMKAIREDKSISSLVKEKQSISDQINNVKEEFRKIIANDDTITPTNRPQSVIDLENQHTQLKSKLYDIENKITIRWDEIKKQYLNNYTDIESHLRKIREEANKLRKLMWK